MSRLIALDTETTGLDPREEFPFEIAAVDVQTKQEWMWTIEPPEGIVERMHPKAAEVNRYHERTSAPDWRWDAPQRDQGGYHPPQLAAVLSEIRHTLDGAHIIGAVPDFDARFLTELYDRYSLDGRPRWHYHLIDIENVAVGWLLREIRTGASDRAAAIREALLLPYDSDELSHLCGVTPPSDDGRHTALGDARWVASWWNQMVGRA